MISDARIKEIEEDMFETIDWRDSAASNVMSELLEERKQLVAIAEAAEDFGRVWAEGTDAGMERSRTLRALKAWKNEEAK